MLSFGVVDTFRVKFSKKTFLELFFFSKIQGNIFDLKNTNLNSFCVIYNNFFGQQL